MLQKYHFILFLCLITISPTFSQIIDSLIIQRQTQIDSISIYFPDSIVTPHVVLITGPAIGNLKAFSNINKIEGHLLIKNTSIDSLVGLENLKSLYSLQLENNLKLQSISKFIYLTQTEFLMINDCPLLKSLDFIDSIETLGYLEIYGNTQNLKKIGDFPNLKQLIAFSLGFNKGVDTIHINDKLGDVDFLIIHNDDLLFFSAANIINNSINNDHNNFRCINLVMSDNKKLNYINASNSATCFDRIEISSNPELKTCVIAEFSDSLVESFKIERNSKLESFTACNNIKTSGIIEINQNENLKELNCFKNLKNALSISIFLNNVLKSLNGAFVLVDTIGNVSVPKSGLSILNNKNLNNIEDLNEVIYINRINIKDNKRLGLCSIKSICNHIDAGRLIELDADNAPGCRSINQIRLGCTTSSKDVTNSTKPFLYPNPFTDYVTVFGDELKSIEVLNIDGYSLFKTTLSQLSFQKLNLENLPPATYIIKIIYGNSQNTQMIKCIKL